MPYAHTGASQPTGNGTNPADNQDQGQESPQAFSQDDAVKLVNAAISSRFKQYDRKLDDLIQTLKPQEPTQDEAEPIKLSKDSVNDLHRQIQNQAKQLDQLTKERDQAKEAQKAQRLDTALTEHLQRHGVSPQLIKAAKAQLLMEQAVSYNTYGEMVFKSDGQEQDLSDGLSQWVQSDDGKAFLPQKQAIGSGSRPTQRLMTSQPQTETEQLTAISQALTNLT